MQENITSWGRIFQETGDTSRPRSLQEIREVLKEGQKPLLPVGIGRSYGDSCIIKDGHHIRSLNLDRFLAFDRNTGILRCEAGVTLAQILQVAVPAGFFLPVTPGTKFVTIAGAIANDVHGKNHYQDGTIGCHVTALHLIRSDGSEQVLTPEDNEELFRATIGGLGLTGMITWVELKLKKASGYFHVENIRFENIDEFFKIAEESNKDWAYTVSWVDCLAKGEKLGRGIFMRGNHNESSHRECKVTTVPKIGVPISFPDFALNNTTIKIFNELYFRKSPKLSVNREQHFEPFFYPLDIINNWNLIYGNRGFYQYQFVLPVHEKDTIVKIFETIADSGQGSFLAVFKEFGSIPSPGMLSFPKPGYTLALDFANLGSATTDLLNKLDDLVMPAGGALYPAKDGRMPPDVFRQSHPKLEEFVPYMDSAFASSFWKRVMC